VRRTKFWLFIEGQVPKLAEHIDIGKNVLSYWMMISEI
jgi:hypothetical protein